jgi:hypothetical protein
LTRGPITQLRSSRKAPLSSIVAAPAVAGHRPPYLYLLKYQVDPQQQGTNERSPKSQHPVKKMIGREVDQGLRISQGNKQPRKYKSWKTLNTKADIESTRHVEKNRHLEHIVETASRHSNSIWDFLSLHELEVLVLDFTTADADKPRPRCDQADTKRQQNHQDHWIKHASPQFPWSLISLKIK